ncbi:B3 domain-containing protein At5g18000-like [Gossypium arboreum]|uniref:B3 domain-containing protein At5g18000-like n=1 Tax=Gossypium arboreum TaxID=29729 RepID=UPI0022F194F8|nr:B3 domain-containing protein At5g18000-like [Gossypium arboreum]
MFLRWLIRGSARGSKIGHGRHKRELNARIQIEYDHSSENETIRYSKRNKESHVPRRKIKNGDGKFDEAMQNKTSARRAIQRLPSKGTAIARALERSIPESFCDEHMEQIPEDVTLKYKHKSWRVRMIICSDRAGRFSIGWRAFVQRNKLKVGDVCVFKMIKKTNIVFEVSIFRDGLTLG